VVHVLFSTKKRKKGDGSSARIVQVVVTNTHFLHNHSLDAGLLVKTEKKAAGRYSNLSPDIVAEVFQMISTGPIPTVTLHAYLQEHSYPDTVKITSVMVVNIKARVLRLHRKYGGVAPSLSMENMRNVFHKQSL
jgi:hypothetical protein